ncbi:hypothetical protein ACSSS7_002265 [Eimeria intestinalis]
MPLPTAPASAIAQSIAAKQRSSQVFDSSATMRRPSACAADQQTQLFARNLRTQVPRSPSLSRGSSSSSSIMHPTQSLQRNYMRTTSSSRRRSRNLPHEVAAESESSQPQLSRQLYRSGSSSRMRSQSPYLNSFNSSSAASSNSAYRRAPLRQQAPPLPRVRAPSASSRGPRVEPSGGPAHRVGSRFAREGVSTLAHVSASWRAETSTSYTEQHHQQAHQKPDSLSSSWVVRDPLTAASNVGFVEGSESGLLQLDVSDQRELANLTASFEQAGAVHLPSHIQYHKGLQQGGSTDLQLPSGFAGKHAVQEISPLGPPSRPASAYTAEAAPRFPSIFDGFAGGPSIPPSQTHANTALRVSATNEQQQQQGHQVPPVSIQQRYAFTAVLAEAGRQPTPCFTVRTDRGQSAGSGVFGRFVPASDKSSKPSVLRRLLDFACWCGRFALVLIVCIWRLLNTSYDSWSARQFTESFKSLLASGGVLGLQPLRSRSADDHWSSSDQWSPQPRESKPSEAQRTSPPPRLSAASLARIAQRQQQQQQQQQQQSAVKQQGIQKTSAAHKSCTGETFSKEMNFVEPLIGDSDPFRGVQTPEVKPDKAFPLAKVGALLGLGLYACWWLLSSAPREELIDFDLM